MLEFHDMGCCGFPTGGVVSLNSTLKVFHVIIVKALLQILCFRLVLSGSTSPGITGSEGWLLVAVRFGEPHCPGILTV